MLDDPSFEDQYRIRVKKDSAGCYTIAYNEKDDHGTFEALITDFDQVWSIFSFNQSPQSNDLERAAKNLNPKSMSLDATLAAKVCVASMDTHGALQR
jgi:hypothetical protein